MAGMFIAFIIVILLFVRKIREHSWGSYSDKSSLKGKIIVVTGANSGIGKETAKQLADREATVILACRNQLATNEAIKNIREYTKNGKLIYMELDLSSFDSVRRFANAFINKFSSLNVLINNAGVSFNVLESTPKTKNGLEMNMGVNHFGHFLLTSLLIDKLIQTKDSRIVIVTSILHQWGHFTLDDLNLREHMKKEMIKTSFLSPGYCASKLANVYHARELAEKLRTYSVDVSAVCPGLAASGIRRNRGLGWLTYIKLSPFLFWYMKTAWQGSQGVVMCATANKLPGKSGDFYSDCKLYTSKYPFDEKFQKELWTKSLEIVQL